MSKIRKSALVCLPSVALLWSGCQAALESESPGAAPAEDVELGMIEQPIWFGTDAARGSHPWIAQISNANGSSFVHNCGGSLIAPDWVLTAAHCVHDGTAVQPIDTFRVTLGEHSLSNSDGSEQVAGPGLTWSHWERRRPSPPASCRDR